MRQLDPGSGAAYRGIAAEQVSLRWYEDAAITVVQLGLMGEGGPDVGEQAMAIYGALDRGTVPAVVREGDQYQLNLENPLVRSHLCVAARGLVRIARRARRWDAAERAQRLVAENRCASSQ
jgi:hypothetical protein